MSEWRAAEVGSVTERRQAGQRRSPGPWRQQQAAATRAITQLLSSGLGARPERLLRENAGPGISRCSVPRRRPVSVLAWNEPRTAMYGARGAVRAVRCVELPDRACTPPRATSRPPSAGRTINLMGDDANTVGCAAGGCDNRGPEETMTELDGGMWQCEECTGAVIARGELDDLLPRDRATLTRPTGDPDEAAHRGAA
jgi:hypothetical protein